MKLPRMFRRSRFLSQKDYVKNLNLQLTMTPQTLKQLRGHGMTSDSMLPVEYFFFTDAESKARSLAGSLEERGYDPDFGPSASDSNVYVVSGWTPKMKMDEQNVVGWTESMCWIGYDHDCEFDGWGTHPE